MHGRYTELLRSHCDLMERVKILIGNEEGFSLPTTGNITPSASFKSFLTRKNDIDSLPNPPHHDDIIGSNKNLTSPMNAKQNWDADLSLEDASIIEDVEDIPKDHQSLTGSEFNSKFNILYLNL